MTTVIEDVHLYEWDLETLREVPIYRFSLRPYTWMSPHVLMSVVTTIVINNRDSDHNNQDNDHECRYRGLTFVRFTGIYHLRY